MYASVLPALKIEDHLRLLLELDRVTAYAVRKKGCQDPVCKLIGKTALHDGSWLRKPRGARVPEECCERFSWCCQTCRHRVMPVSLRFLSRKVYLGAVVAVITAMRCGVTPARMRVLNELAGVSRETVKRWEAWWKETLPKTNLWLGRRGAFVEVKTKELPLSWLEQAKGSAWDRVLHLLRFISPLTGGRRCGAAM